MGFGGSVSGGKIDKNCAILETARSFASMGSRLAYCKQMLSDKLVQKAGITLADCLLVPDPVRVAPVLVPAPVIQPEPKVIVIQAPAVVPVPEVRHEEVKTLTEVGTFQVSRSYQTGLCPSTRVVLGSRGISYLTRPPASMVQSS